MPLEVGLKCTWRITGRSKYGYNALFGAISSYKTISIDALSTTFVAKSHGFGVE